MPRRRRHGGQRTVTDPAGADPRARARSAPGAHRRLDVVRHRRAPLARYARAEGPIAYPFITGHEPCGIIEQINGKRTDIKGDPIKPGDRVVWSYVACGSCYYCSVAVQPCICPHRESWGHNSLEEYPYLLGSVSEYMYVPPEVPAGQSP